MTLEDHPGDIIKKARFIAQVEATFAARTAALSPTEFMELEETGRAVRRPDFKALGPLLDLDSAKLAAVYDGWLPVEPDLANWRELRRITTSRDGMAVHCYLVWDEVTREAALFDTGFDPAPVFALIEEERLDLKHLFITHSHHDHIEGLEAVRTRYPLAKLHSSAKSAPPQHRNRANDFIHLGSLRITNRDTPGHAEDGVTYVIGNFPEDASSVAIVGDAIFAGSIGGARQDPKIARPKVKEQILSLPPETVICAGHGPLTTVGQEREHNPFF